MVVFSMPIFSRIVSNFKGFSLHFPHVNQSTILRGNQGAQVRARGIYTHTSDTGIKIFDENMKKYKSSGRQLTSYIHNSPDISQKEMEDMYAAFPEIVKDFTMLPATAKFARGNERTRELLEYSAAWSPVGAAQTLMADKFYSRKRRLENRIVSEQDERERDRRAHQLAWCIELITRPSYLIDDIMDDHDRRNGLPTWHSLPHIGLGAVNDSALMSQGGYCLLHKYFGDQDYYSHLLNTIYDSLLVFEVAENDQKLMNMFSEETTLESLSFIKGVPNATIVPNVCIIAAMVVNGVRDLELERQVREAGYDTVAYATMIDEYADCYCGELVTQRKTNDISTGKQTWLLFKALELASPEQRLRLKMNYGKDDAASVLNVLEIFDELNIKEVALTMSEEASRKVLEKLKQLPQNEVPVNVILGVYNHYRAVAEGAVARI